MTRIENRKFKLAVWFELICTLLLLLERIDAAQFIELSKWCLGGYLGANVLHRAVEVAVPALREKKGESP